MCEMSVASVAQSDGEFVEIFYAACLFETHPAFCLADTADIRGI